MHEVFKIKSIQPITKILQKLHQFWKTPKNFQKPKNLGQMHEMPEE